MPYRSEPLYSVFLSRQGYLYIGENIRSFTYLYGDKIYHTFRVSVFLLFFARYVLPDDSVDFQEKSLDFVLVLAALGNHNVFCWESLYQCVK